MIVHVLEEPPLEFRAGNRHIDPRFGLATFGPADGDSPTRPTRVVVGLVGPPGAVTELRRWLMRCRDSIDGKTAKPGQENMFPSFPGFAVDTSFACELVFDDALVRELPDRQLRQLSGPDAESATTRAVDLYLNAARSLDEGGRCDVIVCARPDELDDVDESGTRAEDDDSRVRDEDRPGDFHDRLKAAALSFRSPLQLIRRETWTGQPRPGKRSPRPLQDEATRAWNLHTALYYKAGGSP